MKVFVTGGTGAIGGHVVPALVAAGHRVTALARSQAKADDLRAGGATPVIASLFDADALATAMAGHNAVANLATAIPPSNQAWRARAWDANLRIRTEGSAAVIDAAHDAGVDRLIQESITMIYPDRGSAWIDESVPVDDYPLARSNHAAEASAARFEGQATVLRFGVFYGPGSSTTQEVIDLAQRHVAVVLGKPSGYLSVIHLVDAGAAVVAALHGPAGTFNIVDDEPLTKRAHAEAVAGAVGERIWIRGPGRVALLGGDRLTSLTRSTRVSNTRFRQATGWAPRYPSAREGWAATVD